MQTDIKETNKSNKKINKQIPKIEIKNSTTYIFDTEPDIIFANSDDQDIATTLKLGRGTMSANNRLYYRYKNHNIYLKMEEPKTNWTTKEFGPGEREKKFEVVKSIEIGDILPIVIQT